MLFETVISNIKTSSNQAKKLIRSILKMQDFHLKKNIINKKKLYFEGKNAESKNNLK